MPDVYYPSRQGTQLMREFRTKNYTVRVTAEDEFDLDLSFDEDDSVRNGLDSGDLIAFTAHVQVIHRPTGTILGDDYLGSCIYKSYADFMDHRECGKQNRAWAAAGETGKCGSYFSDMISEAIGEARKNYSKMTAGKLREVR